VSAAYRGCTLSSNEATQLPQRENEHRIVAQDHSTSCPSRSQGPQSYSSRLDSHIWASMPGAQFTSASKSARFQLGQDKLNADFRSLDKKRELLRCYVSQAHYNALLDPGAIINNSSMATPSPHPATTTSSTPALLSIGGSISLIGAISSAPATTEIAPSQCRSSDELMSFPLEDTN
jgi:hypothetical protein